MKLEILAKDISLAIKKLLPPEIANGWEPAVTFHRAPPGKRKIRCDAEAIDNFRPESGDEIEVRFVPSTGASVTLTAARPAPLSMPALPRAAQIVLRSLDKAESDPYSNFVGLKRFRDVDLPAEGLAPPEARRELEAAIAAGWVGVNKLNNPRSPYPTATLHLNRAHPEVQAVLLAPPAASPPNSAGFAPRTLGGVSLSETVLAGRR
ncbi:MAG TPA: hypothetical protein VN515_05670 [Terriglobales bacterium]|nr:hypothetical protein [Terriglobales bacterium]